MLHSEKILDVEKEFRDKACDTLKYAERHGASAAEVILTIEFGFSLTARSGDVETLEHHREKNLFVKVYDGQRSGSASTSDLSVEATRSTINKACVIAQHASEDSFSGLADPKLMAYHYPDLQLHHHWNISPKEAIDMAVSCEKAALAQDKRIKKIEDATVSTYEYFRLYANTHGFVGCFPVSEHSMSCSVIAESGSNMQRDYEYTVSRRPEDLCSTDFVAKHAAMKTLKRLGAKKIKTQKCPVIFSAVIAKSLLSAFIRAISGGNLYRQTSFLVNHLNQSIFPDFVNIAQRPHMISGMGSTPFDGDGVKTKPLNYIKEGILNHYVLSNYSARKLGMQTTGNAGGVYNLMINFSHDLDFSQLLKKMGKGLLVVELMGQGVNILTGDYSRGAFGFWIENGEVQYPVEGITIAGNLKDMFANLVAVANDVDMRGNIHTGSILLDNMTVAGL